ncbi:Serine/threonine protein phosphatase PrpC [Duganella sp. CF458]|uniref:PP2C family protein-serine/threonine phosphatase n=1 Tax=Duganella sp. CF458 TaxID=1884368 RepID=UPI0008E39A6F|nr:protein phosphatase 2C domain-containing protein [Duganella sp. CF458]SFG09797.1 Serine/threonine protein phosphatase PrpC [Duganella sp. CF458]
MELTISVLSEPGGRAVNEDAYGCWSSPTACFCVLSDGAGGHKGGAVASRLAVEHALAWFRRCQECSVEGVMKAIAAANTAIVDAQHSMPEYAEMRATIVVLAFDTERRSAIWGHVGDTRLYCFRSRRIVFQTRDHSVLQGMVDAGYMQLEELRSSPQRNVLLAALGDAEALEPCIHPSSFSVCDGDIFLLCTDGFWEHLDERNMEQELHTALSPETWLSQLEGAVRAQGGHLQDNYSALLVACRDYSMAGTESALDEDEA